MLKTRTVFAQLPAEVQERLRGRQRRLKLARLILEELPEANRGPGARILDLTYATGYDRVDVGNAMRLLRDLGLVLYTPHRRPADYWLAPPYKPVR